MDDRERMMLQIQRCDFMLTELRLYLDTHGNCPNALKLYNKHLMSKKSLMEEYSEKYGPLTPDMVNTNHGWTWTESPWPWEGKV